MISLVGKNVKAFSYIHSSSPFCKCSYTVICTTIQVSKKWWHTHGDKPCHSLSLNQYGREREYHNIMSIASSVGSVNQIKQLYNKIFLRKQHQPEEKSDNVNMLESPLPV
jgi:hypothetical protein